MKHRNTKSCLCQRCARIAAGATPAQADAQEREWARATLEKYGWIVHFVIDEPNATGANIHTHGLRERCNHADFQIVYPLTQKTAHQILINLVERVKAGERFEDGQTVADVIANGLLVKLVDATENNRQVLRVILPDRDGKLEPGEIAEEFGEQYQAEPPAEKS